MTLATPTTHSDLTPAAPVTGWPLENATPGWRAELALHFAPRGPRTLLKSKRQSGPLTVQRAFYPEGDRVCHVYLLHPPAGIVGGDDLRVHIELDKGTHALLTTPGATRWYFSRGIYAQVQQIATVADGATLEWLPQETLISDGAYARLLTKINLEGNARFCGWEILGLGRPALREAFEHGSIDFRLEIYRDGRPLLLERQRSGQNGLPGLGDNTACATMTMTGCDAATLEASRKCLLETPESSLAICASTLIGDVLIVRGIAPRCEPLTQVFRNLWTKLRPLSFGRPASSPRIWNT
ncbi:MAG: urease accessory protein UreD [Myxococcota bacterium]